jgi:hypothetical protein
MIKKLRTFIEKRNEKMIYTKGLKSRYKMIGIF